MPSLGGWFFLTWLNMGLYDTRLLFSIGIYSFERSFVLLYLIQQEKHAKHIQKLLSTVYEGKRMRPHTQQQHNCKRKHKHKHQLQ